MTEVATTLRSAYLAGPMRGIKDYNFPAFHKATAYLRKRNWTIFSPAERDENDPNIEKEDDLAGWNGSMGLDYFMSFDLRAVCQMDCVICLPGWEASQGARLETMVATEVGHPVFELEKGRFGRRALKAINPFYIRIIFAEKSLGVLQWTADEVNETAPEEPITLDGEFDPKVSDRVEVFENATVTYGEPVDPDHENVEPIVWMHQDVEGCKHFASEDCPCNPVPDGLTPEEIDALEATTGLNEETYPAAFGWAYEPDYKAVSRCACESYAECSPSLLPHDEFCGQEDDAITGRESPEVLSGTLPADTASRKSLPVATGVLDYFPAALVEVAKVSKAGNDKHNPGQPLHHARGKSTDHADALLRHLIDRGGVDAETGMRHSAELAWRALALLQQELEDAGLAPLPRGAHV